MKTAAEMEKAIAILRRESKKWDVPVVTLVANTGRNPFRILVSCLLSLRTNDKTTAEAVKRLFQVADTPQGLLKIPVKRLEKTIYPVGFYRVKAKGLHAISREILGKHGGKVPSTLEELLTLKGVGRKTANLVVSEAYGKPAICVDTHVHRISNRLGIVKTKSPDETEFALRKKLPRRLWRKINALFVAFGQFHCRPQSPFCSTCKIYSYCNRIGVSTSR